MKCEICQKHKKECQKQKNPILQRWMSDKLFHIVCDDCWDKDYNNEIKLYYAEKIPQKT